MLLKDLTHNLVGVLDHLNVEFLLLCNETDAIRRGDVRLLVIVYTLYEVVYNYFLFTILAESREE
jgi:hypothetical protein